MKIKQIRNATILVDYGTVRLLVDPMLGDKHAYPRLRLFKHRGRNPSIDLQDGAQDSLEQATHCIITHFQKGHFDHLDKAAVRWLRARNLPVFCTPRDAEVLSHMGLKTTRFRHDLGEPQPFFNGKIRTTPCIHGRGIIGSLMEHGVGYFIELPGEPSLFLTGDTVLTAELRHFVEAQRPDVIVAPAGGARFDVGGKIIMDDQDMVSLARLTSGAVVANHIGAISHCPVSRADVTQTAARAGLADRISAPADGEELEFS